MKRKRKSEAKGKEVDLVKQSKAINERPQRLDLNDSFYSLTHKEQYSVVKPFSEKKRRKI